MEIFSVKDLTVNYETNRVLDSVSFRVFEGDFLCVVGANGSGKSTLIKTILGLIKPKSGKIKFKDGILKNSIGYLPQEAKIDPNFPATVYEIALSGTLGQLGRRFFYREEDKKRVDEALKTLKISRLKNKSLFELSGGQKQKVLLARALAATSKLLFLDEPSNNLDNKSRSEFYKILKELNRNGLTIIMITHDLDAEDLIGNKVVAIKNEKVEVEKTEEYIRRFR